MTAQTPLCAPSRLLARARRESGQVLVYLVLALVPLLGMAALAIDIGYAYYLQRSLQASADAAALAGAQELPDGGTATAIARDYGTGPGGKNRLRGGEPVTESITTKCLSSIPGCDPVNAVVVDETAHAKSIFAGVLGIDAFDVHVRSTACSPCGVKPLDIMLVLDRTGSMCQDHSGRHDPSCTDLENAREGMETLLASLDPDMNKVGLAVFPPAPSISRRCNTPLSSTYDSRSADYTVVGLSNDYAENGRLDSNSRLVSTINCQRGGGSTAYANAIEAAQEELDENGSSDVQDIIVFFSDGAANMGPNYYPRSSSYRKQPCHQGVWSADDAKDNGTIIYAVGYDLDALDGGANECKEEDPSGPDERPAITAYDAIRAIASDSDKFYEKPGAGDLRGIFGRIATDMMEGASGLVDNDTP